MGRWFTLVLVAAIAFGVVLRVATLDTKLFWLDETFTQLRVAGHTAAGLDRSFLDGQVRPVTTYRAQLEMTDASTPSAVVDSLVREDSQHPPFFYLFDQLVVRVFGDGVIAWRAAAALCGLAGIAAAWWLGMELFGEGLPLAALAALSPFCLLFSQQAREYGLWVTLTLASTAALLHALSAQRRRWWVVYAALSIVGWYTAILYPIILPAHALVAWLDRRATARERLGFVVAAVASAALFIPWAIVVAHGLKTVGSTTSWGDAPRSLGFLIAKLVFNVGTALYDLEYLQARFAVFGLLPLALMLLGVRTLSRSGDRRPWALITGMLVISTVPFLVADVAQRHHHFTQTRYFAPAIVALLILGAAPFSAVAVGVRTRIIVTLGLAVMGASCSVGAIHSIWWGNRQDATLEPIARAIAADPSPVIWESGTVEAVETSVIWPDAARVAVLRPIDAASVKRAGLPAYLCAPNQALIDSLRAGGLRLTLIAGQSLDSPTVAAYRRMLGRGKSGEVDLNEPTLWRMERIFP